MKDLLYELASLGVGVAEYVLFDYQEGERQPEQSLCPSCRLEARPVAPAAQPSWVAYGPLAYPQRDRPVYS